MAGNFKIISLNVRSRSYFITRMPFNLFYLILVVKVYLWSCRNNEALPNIDSYKA